MSSSPHSSRVNDPYESTWMATKHLFLSPALCDQLARYPLLTTFSLVVFVYLCCSTCLGTHRISSLLFGVINKAYGLHELISHTRSFRPILLSNFSPKVLSSNRDQFHQSLGDPNHGLSNPPSLPIKSSHPLHIDPISQTPKIYYPGLINSSSNLCFLNAVLQSLASMPHVIQHLSLIQSYGFSHTPVANALLEMLIALNTPRNHQAVLKPFSVAQALLGRTGGGKSMLFNSEQQDAQEFLVTMIDALEAEAKILAEHLLLNYQSLKINGLDRTQFCHQARKIQRSPFRGLMAHRIACATCGFTSVIRHSSADHFSLNVPHKMTCRLESCLHEYTKLELLEEYICRKCSLQQTYDKLNIRLGQIQEHQQQTKTNSRKKQLHSVKKKLATLKSAIMEDPERELPGHIPIERVASFATTKQTMFARPPDSLTFHISRSTAYARGVSFKNHCQVTYPEDLILDPYCTTFELSGDATKPISGNQATTNSYRYRLLSVVVHFGSHSFGHYITYRKSPTSKSIHPESSQAWMVKKPKIPEKQGNDPSETEEKEELIQKENDGERVAKQEEAAGTGKENKTNHHWYRISDETVQLSSVEDALMSNPFLLMYERVYEHDEEEMVDHRNNTQGNQSLEHSQTYSSKHSRVTNLDHPSPSSNHHFLSPIDCDYPSPTTIHARPREISSFQI